MQTTNLFRSLALAAAGMMAYATGAHAQMIGLKFGGTLSATTSAGVVPQTNYNNIATNTTQTGGFVDSNGNANATFSLSLSGNNFNLGTGTGGTNPGNAALLGSAVGSHTQDTGGGLLTVTLSNIPYASYNVYVYVNNDTQGRSGELLNSANSTIYYYNPTANSGTFNGTNFTQITTTTSPGSSAATPIGQYVLLTGLTGSTLTLQDTNTPYAQNGPSAGISGIQIVNAVPEPGTWALVGVAICASSLLRRTRRNQS